MSLGKNEAPPAPDYAAAARAQGGANLQSTIATNVMNRPNEVTPLGTRSWSQRGTYMVPAAEGNPAVNVPLWQSRIQMTPLGQQRFDQEQRITGQIGNVAEQGLGRVGAAVAQPFNTGGLPQVAGIPGMQQQQSNAPVTQGSFGMGKGDALRQGIQNLSSGGARNSSMGADDPRLTMGNRGATSATGTSGTPRYEGPLLYPVPQWTHTPEIRAELERGVTQRRYNEMLGIPNEPEPTQQQPMQAAHMGVSPDPRPNETAAVPAGVPPLPQSMQQQQPLPQPMQQAPALPQQQAAPDITRMPNQSDVGDTLYRQATRYMDPQFQQQEEALRTRLVNQGLPADSAAFNDEMRRFNATKQQAYADARDRAMLASGQEQSRQFGLGAQQFAQGMSRGDQAFGQGANLFGMGLAGQGQQFGQEAQRFGMGLTGQGQQFGQEAERFRLGLGAQGQQYGQQAQTYGMSAAERQRALQEQAYMRQLPLNELNALRTGAQVNMPQFQPYSTANVQPAPIMQGAQAQGQSDINRYNAEQAQGGAFTSGLFSLAGQMPWSTWLSDRRLKSNIVRVGTHPLGIGVYEYDIGGERQRGVMADEVLTVRPEAVSRHDSGFLMVDYGRL